MYYCINCDKMEILYFECNKCNKLLCRKCIIPGKHTCNIKEIKPYELDIFCDNLDCIKNKNLKKCKFCKKKFCSDHFSNHKCKVKTCCIM